MKKYSITKEKLQTAVNNNTSIAGVCRELGVVPKGGNYKTIKLNLIKFDISISHFKGQGWNTGVDFKKVREGIPLEDILVENSSYTNLGRLKIRMLNTKLLEYKCSKCKINSWNELPLVLHLDHINGDNLNHTIDNLRLLCPNCHSQTSTYCRSKPKV